MSNIFRALCCALPLCVLGLPANMQSAQAQSQAATPSLQSAGETPQPTAQNLYVQASQALRKSDLAGAIVALEALNQHEDQTFVSVARIHLAELYLATSDYKKAIVHAEGCLNEQVSTLSSDDTYRLSRACLKAALKCDSPLYSARVLERLITRLKSIDAVEDVKPNEELLKAAVLSLLQVHVKCHAFASSAQLAQTHQALSPQIANFSLQLPFLEAKHHFSQKSFRLAYAALQQIDLDELVTGDQIAARFLLLECCLRMGELTTATEQSAWFDALLAKLTERPSWAATLRLRQTELAVAKRDYRAAADIIQLAKARYPDFKLQFEFDFLAARIAIANINFTQANAILAKLSSDHSVQSSAGIRARWMQAELEFMQRRYATAAGLYREVIASDHATWKPIGLLQLAKCQELLGDAEEALASYEQVVATIQNSTIDNSAPSTHTEAATEARRRIAQLHSGNIRKR